MNEQALEQLRRLCAEMSIGGEVEAALIRQAGFISTWKSQIKPADITPSQRVKKLQRIHSLAMDMQREVEALSLSDRWDLDASLSILDLGGDLLPSIQRSVEELGQRAQTENRRGAPNVTHRQADFIRCIAQALKSTDIAPANSGRFADLCEAVFLAGGLTFPERALRYFMKDIRPQLKADGFCG